MKKFAFSALLLCLGCSALAKPLPKRTIATTSAAIDTLHIGSTVLSIEIADDEPRRIHGLSDRATMGWNEGMLFSFPDADRRRFWMIDCHFDLDIAYLSPDGTIRDIQAMAIQPGTPPDDLLRYPSATNDIMYALEVNRGWFAAHNAKVGQKLTGVLRHSTKR